jgi:hypothetical protein
MLALACVYVHVVTDRFFSLLLSIMYVYVYVYVHSLIMLGSYAYMYENRLS